MLRFALRSPQQNINFNAITSAHQQASSYHPNIGLSKRRKQQPSYITARSLESRKHRNVDYENQRKKEILRRQLG